MKRAPRKVTRRIFLADSAAAAAASIVTGQVTSLLAHAEENLPAQQAMGTKV